MAKIGEGVAAERKKPRRRFLFLAIGCFAGLIAIFVVDGYLGIYDTFHISVGEYPAQTITADYWLNQGYGQYEAPRPVGAEEDKYAYCCIGADWGQTISFKYVIENHQSSTYSAHIQASAWKGNEKITDLSSDDVTITPFREVVVEWTLSADDLVVGTPVSGQSYDYTVRVNRGDVERRVIVEFYYSQNGIPPEKIPPEG
jgi:hypothetical protein